MAQQYSFAGGRSAAGAPVLRSATIKAPDQPGADPSAEAGGAPPAAAPAMLGSGTPDVMPAAMPATNAGAAGQMASPPSAPPAVDAAGKPVSAQDFFGGNVPPNYSPVNLRATDDAGANQQAVNQKAGYDVGAWNALPASEQARYQFAGGAPGQQAPVNRAPLAGDGRQYAMDGAPGGVAGGAGGGNLSPIDPANSLRGQQIGFDVPTAPVQFGGTTVDPGQRLNFDINPGSVQDAASKAFQSQLPLLDSDFALQARDLSRSTAAMGRTGSGLFNRGTNELSDRGRATREALLGNLSYGAAGTDAGNRLQADIARSGLQNAQEGRFMQASQASAGNATQAGMFNAGRADQLGLERIGLQERQQQRQDNLAQQANNNLLAQLGLFGQGFQGDPSQSDLGASAALSQSAGQFGGNAAQQSQAGGDLLGSLASGPLGQYALNLLKGGQTTPPPTPDNYYAAD